MPTPDNLFIWTKAAGPPISKKARMKAARYRAHRGRHGGTPCGVQLHSETTEDASLLALSRGLFYTCGRKRGHHGGHVAYARDGEPLAIWGYEHRPGVLEPEGEGIVD